MTADLLAAELSDLKRQITRIEGMLIKHSLPSPILTLAEAKLLTRKESDSAFYEWANHYAITPCSRGRYSLRSINRALTKESLGK